MVLILAIPVRRVYRLHDLITERHLENSAKLMLGTGLVLGYAYVIEPFTAWYSGSEYEMYAFYNRAFGPYWWAFWLTIVCNVAIPQALWWSRVRKNTTALLLISLSVLYGMWMERYMIIIGSLHRDFLPSSWSYFSGTIWDHATIWGTVGVFLLLFLLFIRLLPMISMYEIRELVHESEEASR
jgi:molybdopterin-containing oxidoreductase family membrane subunit